MKETDGREQQSKDETKECLNDFKKRFETKIKDPKFALEVSGFVVLCIYAIFTIFMYFANKQSANAADSAAQTAASTLTASQQQSQLDQRAWVGVSDSGVHELTPKDFRAFVEFFNSGKTPAYRVQRSFGYVGHTLPLRDGPTPEEVKKYLHLSGNGVVAPQARATIYSLSDRESYAKMMSHIAANYPAISAGTDILYIFGELRYFDVNEHPHSTQYCFYIVKVREHPLAWTTAECNQFNGMD